MEARDVARITYELVRIRDDRQLMEWEDDRGTLLREIRRLHHVHRRDVEIHKKDASTAATLQKQVEELKALILRKTGATKALRPDSDKRTAATAPPNAMASPDTNAPGSIVAVAGPDGVTPGSATKKRKCDVILEEVAKTSVRVKEEPLLCGSAAVGYRRNVSNAASAAASPATKVSPAVPSSSVRAPGAGKAITGSGAVKYIDDSGQTRKRDVREALPGHVCFQCKQYFDALRQQGIAVDEEAMRQTLQNCSRHKAQYSPPSTPAGFWDLTVKTPDDWK
jgi:hypothetical protein